MLDMKSAQVNAYIVCFNSKSLRNLLHQRELAQTRR